MGRPRHRRGSVFFCDLSRVPPSSVRRRFVSGSALTRHRRTLAALPFPNRTTPRDGAPSRGRHRHPPLSLRDIALAGLVIHDDQPCRNPARPRRTPSASRFRAQLVSPSRSAHRGLDANPAPPALRPLPEHALSQPASPAYQAHARHRELHRIAPLRLRLQRRLSNRSRHHDRSSEKKKADRNRPDLRITQPGPLLSPPVHVASVRHDAPTYSVCHEDRATQAACAPGSTEMKKQRCTPVQASACGDVSMDDILATWGLESNPFWSKNAEIRRAMARESTSRTQARGPAAPPVTIVVLIPAAEADSPW